MRKLLLLVFLLYARKYVRNITRVLGVPDMPALGSTATIREVAGALTRAGIRGNARPSMLCLAMVFLLYASPTQAQVPTVPISTPFKVTASHDGLDVTGYRCYVDAVKVGADLPPTALQGGVVTCPMPGVNRGAHTVQVGAFNADGETKSAALAFTGTGKAPNAPGQPQIVLNIAVRSDGSVVLTAVR